MINDLCQVIFPSKEYIAVSINICPFSIPVKLDLLKGDISFWGCFCPQLYCFKWFSYSKYPLSVPHFSWLLSVAFLALAISGMLPRDMYNPLLKWPHWEKILIPWQETAPLFLYKLIKLATYSYSTWLTSITKI